jgi:hypothetical protein
MHACGLLQREQVVGAVIYGTTYIYTCYFLSILL